MQPVLLCLVNVTGPYFKGLAPFTKDRKATNLTTGTTIFLEKLSRSSSHGSPHFLVTTGLNNLPLDNVMSQLNLAHALFL
jgi:hypothetical protein